MEKGASAGHGIEEILRIRREKAEKLAALGWPSFPNGIDVRHTASDVRIGAESITNEVQETDPKYRIGGRILMVRSFGKAMFLDLIDRTGKIQVQLRKDLLGDDTFARAKLLDIGDII